MPDQIALGAEVQRAMHAARTHCPISWPEGDRCLNCAAEFPCDFYKVAVAELTEAGWSDEEISRLDQRTGPWS